MKIAVLVLALVALVHADMYLHNPRGSNNRLDEARRDRNNANRLFDSQNNNRGGYNVGSLYYYAGSVLPIEWTNQHSCADQNNNCEIIFQYMCDDNVRDGASTNTIPSNRLLCENYDCNTDLEYGMHESYDYYIDCHLRKRNMGLFTADRNIRGQNARYTRQNQNGNRRGYECPEERDYYPYWHPTPWRDIAVLTNNAQRCPYYQQESANIKSRYACVLPQEYIINNVNLGSRNYIVPNTQDECETWTRPSPSTGEPLSAEWREFPADPRLSAPDCVETLWSRDNHLGNSVGGYTNLYNWTIPDLPHEHCILRARYNISTGEYDGWNSSINANVSRLRNQLVFNENANAANNRRTISELDVYSQFGFNFTTARERGYVFRQNPIVKIFPDPAADSVNFGLQLAINTNQFGRTFQDRSHTFAIRSKPDNVECDNIYNLNVRGKRGNIVQTYPGVEYDFVPNDLQLSVGSCVHIQWTGSNTNPNNNDGQGRAGTDRSNMVLLRSKNYPEGTPGVAVPEGEKFGHFGNSYPQHLDHNETFLNLDREARDNVAMLGPSHMGGEMSELDDAGTYFDLGLQRVTSRGTYYYLCTRNNNFTNRSQKGKIIVGSNARTNRRIGWNGGSVEMSGSSLQFSRGTLNSPRVISMETFSNDSSVQAMTNNQKAPGKRVSDYVQADFETANGEMATIRLTVSGENLDTNTKIYRASPSDGYVFRELETRMVNGQAEAQTSSGGIFVAANAQVATYVVIATVCLLLVVIVSVSVGVAVYFRVRRDKWNKVKSKVSGGAMNIKRSFAKKV